MIKKKLAIQIAQRIGNGREETTKLLDVLCEVLGDTPVSYTHLERNSRRIVGAQMASTEDISMGIHMFSLAIEQEVTIDQLKLLDLFFLPHFNQPYNYITMAALSAK